MSKSKMDNRARIDNIVGSHLGYHCAAGLRAELIEAAQKYRDEGVAEVGMKCIKEQMEEPKTVIIDSLSDLYEHLFKDTTYSAAEIQDQVSVHIHQAMDARLAHYCEQDTQITHRLYLIQQLQEAIKEASKHAKPVTHRQQEWIATIEFVLGIKFTGDCYDDAWTWIAENRDEAAFEQKHLITKEQRKAIKDITKYLHVTFSGKHWIHATKFIHKYAGLAERVREECKDMGSYYAGQ